MITPESAEKMQIVVDSLRANPEIVIVGGYERNYLKTVEWPTPNGFWSRTLDIYTYPVRPTYDADELNEFMLGLVPELEPTRSDRFHGGDRRDDNLSLGVLYYDESIGTAALSATVQLNTGMSVVTADTLAPEWTTSRTLDLSQRTWVRVFPDAGHVADAAEGINRDEIPVDELRRRGTGRIIAGLFQAPMLGGVIESSAETIS